MKATNRKVRPKFALVLSVIIVCHAIASITCQERKQEENEKEEEEAEEAEGEHDGRATISTSNINQNVHINNQQESIKVGNHKTNNYHVQAANYQPTQHTQLVFNVAKWKGKKKLRSSRPPTVEEYAIKRRILDVYDGALEELAHALGTPSSGPEWPHLQHLGRILKALNPKYIATMRVREVAFADPLHPERAPEVVPPESELPPPTDEATKQPEPEDQLVGLNSPVELRADPQGQPPKRIQEQLDAVSERFRSSFKGNQEFVQQLLKVPDENFTPSQLAYKRLFQCLEYPSYCAPPEPLLKKPNKGRPYEDGVHRLKVMVDGDDLQVQHGSNVEPTRVLPPPNFQPPPPEVPTGKAPTVGGELDQQAHARSPRQYQVGPKVGPSYAAHSIPRPQYVPRYQPAPLWNLPSRMSRNQRYSNEPMRPDSQMFDRLTLRSPPYSQEIKKVRNSYAHH